MTLTCEEDLIRIVLIPASFIFLSCGVTTLWQHADRCVTTHENMRYLMIFFIMDMLCFWYYLLLPDTFQEVVFVFLFSLIFCICIYILFLSTLLSMRGKSYISGGGGKRHATLYVLYLLASPYIKIINIIYHKKEQVKAGIIRFCFKNSSLTLNKTAQYILLFY